MSFSAEVKGELCRETMQKQCCAQAEAYGVLLYCNTFSSREIRIITENTDFSAITAACIGQQTEAAAHQYNLHTITAEKATMDALIQRIVEGE